MAQRLFSSVRLLEGRQAGSEGAAFGGRVAFEGTVEMASATRPQALEGGVCVELRLPLEMSPGREAACRAVFGTWGFFRTMHGKTAPSC